MCLAMKWYDSLRLEVKGSSWGYHPIVMPLSAGHNPGMSLGTILLIILILILVGTLPSWPYSSGWGYYHSSGLGVVVVIVLIFVLMGKL